MKAKLLVSAARSVSCVLSVLCVSSVAFADADDHWTYDPNGEILELKSPYTGGVVSDGVWKFKATVSGSNIKFGMAATNEYPEVTTPIDFSKPIQLKDDPSTTYTLTELNGCFGFYRNGAIIPEWGLTTKGWDACGYRPIREKVGTITFPASGLTKIGDYAFTQCFNSTGVLVIPASVTTVGTGAFSECSGLTLDAGTLPTGLQTLNSLPPGANISGVVNLPNIKTIANKVFQGSSITSATLGASVTKLSGDYACGVFAECKSLTSVTIDPEANCELVGGVFYNCTALTELDLRGVTKAYHSNDNGSYPNFAGCGATKYTFSPKLTMLFSYSFRNCNAVQEIHFYGAPPTFNNDKVLLGANSTGVIVTYVHLDEEDEDYATQKAAWDALTEGGEIAISGSTWKSSMIDVSVAQRPLYLYKEKEKGELGHWIYDDSVSPAIVSNGLWSFKATLAGDFISFGEFVTVPDEPTEIDFSKRITDRDGVALTITGVDTKFGHLTGGNFTYAAGYAGAEKVSRIVFPSTNALFTTIGEYAFCGCTNCTEVTPCIPDSVTSLGKGAFALVKTTGDTDIRLYSISSIESGLFWKVPVTSVVFGPDLRRVWCSWNDMAFQDNKSLTNVVFDAAMKDGYTTGSSYGAFSGCTNVERLDLSGFKTLSINLGEAKEYVFSTNLVTLSNGFFNNGVTNIIFNCPPPTGLATPIFNDTTYNHASYRNVITTTVPKEWLSVTNANGKCWYDYAANGEIWHKNTTWAEEFIQTDYGMTVNDRLLLSPDHIKGLTLFVR